jgi:hypothetical protein
MGMQETEAARRIIVDHVRACVYLLADGVLPRSGPRVPPGHGPHCSHMGACVAAMSAVGTYCVGSCAAR